MSTEHWDLLLESAQADYWWAGADVRVVDRPELAFATSPRNDVVLNQVVRARPQLVDPRRLADEVEPHHVGKASRWALNAFSDTPAMTAVLDERGFELTGTFHGYVLDPTEYTRVVPAAVEVVRASSVDELRIIDQLTTSVFQNGDVATDEQLARDLANCNAHNSRVGRFLAKIDDEPVGAGGISLFPALNCAFIWGGCVAPNHRGRGAYTALLAARCAFAASRGIPLLAVYGNINTSGPILLAHGFTRCGRMHQWSRAA